LKQSFDALSRIENSFFDEEALISRVLSGITGAAKADEEEKFFKT